MTSGWRTKVGSWSELTSSSLTILSFFISFLVAFSPISLHSLRESGLGLSSLRKNEASEITATVESSLVSSSSPLFSSTALLYISTSEELMGARRRSRWVCKHYLSSFFVAFFGVCFFSFLHVFMERSLFCLYLSFLCWKSSLKFENSLFANETNEFRSCCTPNKRFSLREPQKRENYIRLSSANPPQQRRTYDENWKFSMLKIPEIHECLKWI